MKTGILYFTTCFHGFGILRHVDPFVRMLHIYRVHNSDNNYCYISTIIIFSLLTMLVLIRLTKRTHYIH